MTNADENGFVLGEPHTNIVGAQSIAYVQPLSERDPDEDRERNDPAASGRNLGEPAADTNTG